MKSAKFKTESKLCLGCMSFGLSRWRPWVLDEGDAVPLLDCAIALGLRFFDTANVYSGGESERILGRFIRERGLRDEVTIATKLFYDTPDLLGSTGLGRKNIFESTHASLARLGVDCIDLLQIHRWDENVDIEETLEAFAELIEQGKIKSIGASNLSAWQLAKTQIVAARLGLPGFSAVQPHYNMLYREDERELIPLCLDQNITLLPWSPLARGRLARSVNKNTTERASTDDVATSLYGDSGQSMIEILSDIAKQEGEAPATIALSWLVKKGMVPIFGATKKIHIEQAARAADHFLGDDVIAKLDAAYIPVPPVELPYTAKNQIKTSELTESGEVLS